MKKFNLLLESLGVPDDIHETAVLVFDKIFNEIDLIGNKKIQLNNNLNIYGNFKIGDHYFDHLNFRLNIEYDPSLEKVTFKKASMFTPSYYFSDIKIKEFILDPNTSVLTLHIAVPENNNEVLTYKTVTDYMEKDKIQLVSTLAHELKHKFDNSKFKKIKTKQQSTYDSYSQNFDLEPIKVLMNGIYFTTNTENLVRSSELNSILQMKNITKKEFEEYLKTDRTYGQLKLFKILNIDYIIKWTGDYFKNDLDDFLIKNRYNVKKLNFDQKIDLMFQLTYKQIEGNKIDNLYLSSNDVDSMYGNVEYNIKNKKYMDFFERKISDMNYKANEVIKKISKLYATLKENNTRYFVNDNIEMTEKLRKLIDKMIKEVVYENEKI